MSTDRQTPGGPSHPAGLTSLMFSLANDHVHRRTSARRGHIYIDRAMPEHIARALVGGLVLSLPPGQLCLCTA
jgi:hypothetical protein